MGVVLSLVGPFGTYESLAFLTRLVYWLSVVSLNWLLSDLIIRRVDAQLAPALPMRSLSVPLLGSLIAAIPATSVVAVANGLSGIGWPSNIVILFGQVLLLVGAISVPVYTLDDLREMAGKASSTGAEAPAQDTADPGFGRFLKRLPDPLEGPLLCLEMHDHYLAVHTTAGKQLILCRMEDAAEELRECGARVHRSWWVATDAVTAVERDGQRLMLRLTDDRLVPVGKTYRNTLSQIDWIATSQRPD